MKKRSGAHEHTIRELQFDGKGIRLSEPLRHFRGILTGVPVETGGGESPASDEPRGATGTRTAPGAGPGAVKGSRVGLAGRPAGEMTTAPASSFAVACVPMPARRSSSSGRRSQPPRPTTIVSPASPSRAHSSETRPSRMRMIRSATLADSGSWLTITVVQPASRTSSPISS